MTHLSVEWHYHKRGDHTGQPILFLHGFMGSGQIWLPTMERLGDSYYSLALDLPGHGRTKSDLEQLDFETLAESLMRFASTNLNKPPMLAGYSLGGRVALFTALRYPDYFSGLVLESATAGIEDEAARCKRLEHDTRWAEKLRGMDMRPFLTEWYRQPVFEYLKPELITKIIAKKTANNPLQLAEVLLRLSQGYQPPLWNKISEWGKPILIIAGEKDKKYCTIARRMASLTQKSTLAIVSDAGHIVHLENNKDFVGALKSFTFHKAKK